MNKNDQTSSDVHRSDHNDWHSTDSIHHDLMSIKDLVYDSCHFKCSQPLMEAESMEYGAYTFQLNGFSIRFRVAKTTPTKPGQFVTLWKRIEGGPIQPYDISDPVDFFVISTRKDNHFGQFIFPKSVLCKHDVISNKGKGGKRAIRIYPPWEKNLNRQAQKTQQWQIKYFLDISQNRPIDSCHTQMLYSFLRTATLEDANAIANVYLASRKELVSFAPLIHTDDSIKQWVREVLLVNEQVIVAEKCGAIIGMMSLTSDKGIGRIKQLYVLPSAVGHGIGTSMISMAKSILGSPIQLYTFQENIGTRRFYERHGFRAIEFDDGSGNEENCPAVLYEWKI